MRKRGRWPGDILLTSMAVLGFIFFRFLSPFLDERLPACPILKHTGFYCPGCGGTRAANSLVHFQFRDAFSDHAWFTFLVLGGFPLLIWSMIKERYPSLRGPHRGLAWRWIALYCCSLFVFTILRNFELFSYLAPTSRSVQGK